MQKVLITGINGFIGSAIANQFLENGNLVYGIGRQRGKELPYKVYVRDMVNESLQDILKEVNPGIIIHCAGCADVNYSIKNPTDDLNGNVLSFHRLLFEMKECKLSNARVVFLSSAAVYGQPNELPIREWDKLEPISPYALHKKMAEDICYYFNSNYGFNIVIARIFSAYGPGLRKQIFWDMSQKIKNKGKLELFGTGLETRDFIYIDDLINAIILLATTQKLNYEVYNVANGIEITIREIAELFLCNVALEKEKLEFSQKTREGNPNNWRADIARLQELGYKQQITINQGIHNYVNWIREMQ